MWIGRYARGNCWNPDGYFENINLRHAMFVKFGRDFNKIPEFQPFKDEVIEIIKREGCDRPWGYKTGAQYAHCFKEFSPKNIKIRRDMDKVLDSYARCGFLKSYPNAPTILQRGYDIMDSLDGPDIHYERILKRDYGELREALEYCNLTFDKAICDRFVRTDP